MIHFSFISNIVVVVRSLLYVYQILHTSWQLVCICLSNILESGLFSFKLVLKCTAVPCANDVAC
jgi:hypothetical protein